jgi:hypothetical protein
MYFGPVNKKNSNQRANGLRKIKKILINLIKSSKQIGNLRTLDRFYEIFPITFSKFL